MISKYVEPRFGRQSLRDLPRLTLQQYFSGMAGKVSYPTISKIRDVLSSILRSAVDVDYLSKNPMEGLRLPLDKRPRQPKPTITPEQFNNLVQLVAEPYATMLYVSVCTGLRISELIGSNGGAFIAIRSRSRRATVVETDPDALVFQSVQDGKPSGHDSPFDGDKVVVYSKPDLKP
jgi:integrase